jgi:ribosomal protein S18 acetylase RimI-like enzyme
VGADVTIRSATAADEAAITDLHARCIGDAFAGRYVPPAEERAERQSGWAGLIGAPHPRHALLLAESAGCVVGFVAVGPARDADCDSATSAELRVILVDARERRLGVGSALIASAERAMQASGFSDATLWVLPDNAQAVRCYERCGWRADGTERITDFGGSEIRSVRYRRPLAS